MFWDYLYLKPLEFYKLIRKIGACHDQTYTLTFPDNRAISVSNLNENRVTNF